CRQYYEQDDDSVLPRSIANFKAFENAMTLDIAMGGSTNTVLHLLAAAQEAGVDFTMSDIDRLSRRVPCLSKLAPATDKYHIEDVHRAGGILGILAELARADLLHLDVGHIAGASLGELIQTWDIMNPQVSEEVRQFYKTAPGNVRSKEAFSQNTYYAELDTDRENGCIRSREHAYSQDGGLAVLYGNLAE